MCVYSRRFKFVAPNLCPDMNILKKIFNSFFKHEICLFLDKPLLQQFFDNVVWYGTPYVENFLKEHSSKLMKECNREIWEKRGLGFKPKAHFKWFQNDYQYLLAYIVYRFNDPGAYYSFAIELYKKTVKDIYEASTLLEIWFMFTRNEKQSFTKFGFFSNHSLTENEINRLKHIKDYRDGISSRLAKILLGEDFIRKSHLSYAECCDILGFDPDWLINSEYYDGRY